MNSVRVHQLADQILDRFKTVLNDKLCSITVLAGSTSVQIAKNLAVKMNASYVESSLRVFADENQKLTLNLDV